MCLWEWFFMFSKRNSGYVDYVEFYMCMAAMGFNSVSEEKAFKLFSKFHKYGKFHIDYDEFKELWAHVVKKSGRLKSECKAAAGKRSMTQSTETLLQAIQDEDDFDAQNFEQAKLGAFNEQKRKRMARSEMDSNKRRGRLGAARIERRGIAIKARQPLPPFSNLYLFLLVTRTLLFSNSHPPF